MRVLITGVSGYIGSFLAELFDQDAQVETIVGIDVAPPRRRLDKLVHVQRSVTAPFADVLVEHGVDAAIHLAFIVDPMRDSDRQRRINIGGTANFLAACSEARIRNVTLASSATAYGAHQDNPVPMAESQPLRADPSFPYAFEKVVLEQLAAAFGSAHPRACVKVVRPTIVAGPHVSNFISRSFERTLMPIVSGMDPLYQMVFEEDAARAFYEIARHGGPGAFNVAPDDAVALGELSRLAGARTMPMPYPLARLLVEIGWRAGITAITEAPPGLMRFLTYPWVISPERLISELGFQFRFGTRQTLQTFLNGKA
ncbi:MAG: NAD-dependent epimerase/dehydratase family protein [Candidatus Schekmanbacteria bacterium]|nr:NAD-dependent epimerase/dehydratase family protein [Candidatus Schekmanbacteria bacterium]